MMKDNHQSVDPARGHARTTVELRNSELRYRRLFETAKDGILIVDAETGMVVDVNPFLIERLGFSREQFLHEKVWELGLFRDIIANKASFEELKRKEYIRYADKPLRTADGSTLSVEFVSNVYLVDDHRVIQCNVRDITERKASEEKMGLMQALIERSKDAIYVVDPATTRVLNTNESGFRILGYTREELLALPILEVLVGVDRAMFDSTLAKIERAGHAVFDCIHRCKDGSTYPAEASISLVTLSRRYLIAIVRDITERRNADDALRREQALFSELGDAVPDNIYFKDRQSRFVRVNSAMARYFGLGHATEVVGMTDFDVFDAKHARKAFAEEQRIMETGEPMIGVEEKETWPDGHVTWVSSTKTPLRDAKGHITGLVGISRDITEKKLLEEKYLHAQRLESIGMLAAGIAHDLNNVLAPIMFAAPLLRSSLSTPADLKVLDVLEQSAGRGVGLVKQILGFVHRATGEFQPTQVRHLAQDILNLIEQTFPKSIHVRSSLPNDLWQVMGDATQIHQVLLNLCVNARDAMPEGGTLRLSAANRKLDPGGAAAIPGARPGAFIVLEVADTGGGIPPEVMQNIWKPFFTTKSAGRGTGLGLTTVRGIVASHSGFVELQTKVGSGTTFKVYLPAIECVALTPEDGAALRVPGGTGEVILVVDDEEAIRKVVTSALERQGYSIASCSDGAEAVPLFKARPEAFALVITDVDMPRIGGAELIRELLKIRPDVRVLVMGGLSRPEAEGQPLSDAQKLAQAFLQKPFTIGELLRSVHLLLHPVNKP
jgi:PAS domain S-box-containing protein